MNEFGVMAEQHWQKFLPSRTAALEDPTVFFTDLGQQVAEEIETLTFELAGDPPEQETYLERVGRLEAARRQAREKVLSEQVLLPAEPGSPMDEEAPDEQPPASSSSGNSPWIPVRENPSDPWWAEQEQDD
jgi:hypothetical protein